MKASVATLVSISTLIFLYGPASAAAAPRGSRGDRSQTEEICVNPTQCISQDDCCCGYVCAVSGLEDPLPACYPVTGAFCPPKGPVHKAGQQKNGFMGCLNPDRCLYETDCCCGFSCVTKIGAEKHQFLDPVCAAVYDGRCPPEYEGSDPEDQVSTAEVDGKEAIMGFPDAIFRNEHSGEYRQDITEDESATMGCGSLGNVCDILHRCCTGYSCTNQQDSVIKDPLRKGLCKIVMLGQELRR